MDRNGLRPLRYTVTEDGLLIVGSETGMVRSTRTEIVEKGRVGPGQMIAVDLDNARFYHDGELKDLLAARQPFSEWASHIKVIDSIIKTDAPEPVLYEGEALRRRQFAAGFTLEDLELILHPMVEDAQGSRRLDGRRHAARGAVGPLSRPASFLPAELQPGHQPADRHPARDAGDDAEDPARQSRQRAGRGCQPVQSCCSWKARCCSNAEFTAMRDYHGQARPASSIAPSRLPTAEAGLRDALRAHPRRKPRRRVRARLLARDPDRRECAAPSAPPIPMILATGGGAHASGAPVAAHLHLASTCARPSAWTCITSRC